MSLPAGSASEARQFLAAGNKVSVFLVPLTITKKNKNNTSRYGAMAAKIKTSAMGDPADPYGPVYSIFNFTRSLNFTAAASAAEGNRMTMISFCPIEDGNVLTLHVN